LACGSHAPTTSPPPFGTPRLYAAPMPSRQ
jgi:hypothetical protein